MGASRVVLAVLAVLAASSIRAAMVHAQAAGSAAPDVAPGVAKDPDDDEGTSSGSGKPLTAPAAPQARIAWLRERVDAAIAAQPKLASAKIAVSVVDLATGAELVARDADRGMSLASTAKLLTSTAALATLGGGFRWRTSVHGAEPDDHGVIAGELYIKGRGDPMLGVAELRALAADVAARGVRSVDRLVVDDSYFDDVVEPPHFEDQKSETAAFRAPVAGLGVARSSVAVIVVADPGGKATVTLDPDPGDFIKLINKGVTSVTRGRTRIAVTVKEKPDRRSRIAGGGDPDGSAGGAGVLPRGIDRRSRIAGGGDPDGSAGGAGVLPRGIDHLEIEVSGQIRWGEGSWEVKKRVADPARFAGDVFRRVLAEHGVKVKARTIGKGVVPATAKLLAAHDSAPLTEVLRHMNKLSDNYLAECVLKTLGAETRPPPGPATWIDGRAAVHAYLAKIGIPEGGYRADNGSGLFDATAVSARQMTTVLRAAHQDFRIGPDLIATLPVGGVDGTLAKRWHGHPARGRVRAKTGTLDKVIALAGYLALDSGHPLGFAILVNDIPPGQRASARTASDDIIDALAAYLGTS